MRLFLEINEKEKQPFGKLFYREIIRETLKKENERMFQNRRVFISLAFVSPKEIRQFNKSYRGRDEVTDVLSFPEYLNKNELRKEKRGTIFLGEIIVCYNDIRDYAQKNKKDVKKEMREVVVHGTLHLLGWDHEKEMFDLQKKIIKNF